MKWFKHDSNANMDAKLQEILLDFGLEGYGLYWYCIEMISSNVDKDNLTFELEHDARIIARNTGSSAEKVESMMKKFVEHGLFQNSQGVITCYQIAKRADDYIAKIINKNNNLKIESDKDAKSPTKSDKNSNSPNNKNRLDKNRLDKNRLDNKNTVSKSTTVTCPHKEIIELYHNHLPQLQRVLVQRWAGSKREKDLRTRWNENEEQQSLAFWNWYFACVSKSKHHIGENERSWKADLGWLVKRDNFDRLVEKFNDE